MKVATGAERAPDGMKPPIKWAGGKTRLLPELLKRVPSHIADLRYHEPFLGGGALFFALRPAHAHLNDLNANLIGALTSIRDEGAAVLQELVTLETEHNLETFLKVRELLANPDLPSATRAAVFLYLNRTCFNGLYRVNRSGKFNVPFGHYRDPRIVDVPMITRTSLALQNVKLTALDFEEATAGCAYGDFVYFDPPYVPMSETASFTGYTENGFDDQAQYRLSATFARLAHRGAYVMLSQSDHDFARRLYKGFHITSVENSRSVSANGDSRGKVPELIIRNYR